MSTKLFKDEFRFRVIVCATIEELHNHIAKSQLTYDLGGDLIYSHHEWIQQRIVRFSLKHSIDCFPSSEIDDRVHFMIKNDYGLLFIVIFFEFSVIHFHHIHIVCALYLKIRNKRNNRR